MFGRSRTGSVGEGADDVGRLRGGVELHLPTWASGNIVEVELLPLSIDERWRAMGTASSLSSSTDKLKSFWASAAESMPADKLPDPFPGMPKGRGGEQRGREGEFD